MLAVALTMGTMNVYLGGAAELTGGIRNVALFTLATVAALAVFSSWFLAVPILAAGLWSRSDNRCGRAKHRP